MREFLEDRMKLVVGAVLALVVIAGYSAFGRDRVDEATSATGDQLAQGITGPAGQAHDTKATDLILNAVTALETVYAERDSFDGALALGPSIAPHVQWTPGAAAQAVQNQVAVQFTPTNLGYVLNTTSGSGTTFTYSRDDQAQVQRTCGPGCTW